MPDTAVTWPAIGAAITILVGLASLGVNIRGQLKQAAVKSEERARRMYEKIDGLQAHIDVTYVRKDIHAEQMRRVQDAAEEAQRMVQDVAARVGCPRSGAG